jgi:hypothetical protein
MDALLPYAEIEGGKIKNWRTVSTTVTPPPAAAPAAAPAPAKKAEIVDKPLTIPKTQDGKIDGTKLVLGQTYTDSEGNVQAWNGMKFQPLNK